MPAFLVALLFNVFISLNLSAQWTPQVSGTDVLLIDVFFVNTSTGWLSRLIRNDPENNQCGLYLVASGF